MAVEQVVEDSPQARRREQRGWYFYDWANSAFPTTVLTVFLGPYLTTIAETAAQGRPYVDVLWFDVRPSAYYSFVVGTAAILQIILMPIAGALADHTGRKKELMGLFAYLGAGATMCFWFLSDGRYLLGGALFVTASTAFASAFVIYNSFLPEISTPDERDKVSAQGWGFGYLGGGLLLAVNLALFLGHESFGVTEGQAVRIALSSAGLWWAGFTIIPLLRLRNRRTLASVSESTGQAVAGSFRQLGRTIVELRRYPLTLGFLVAYLIYNDGVQTVISFSATYADKELELDQSVQIGAILMVQFVAFGGALLLGRLAASYGAKRVVMGALVGWTAVVGVAYFLPKGSAPAFFALGFAIAIVMGGTQALSRSLYSHVIPAGKEAEYYSLYEISDKGSTFLGSFTLALALQLTDSYRLGIISLMIFFVIGFVLLAAVNLPRAIRAAGNEVPDRV
ncbi:MFS transporter [Streptosporangium roseum]|uniref:Major facilitator superfamily permease/BtlA-like protein n=1 Tax=Streptosporangium roseum (strain ATCC 12428 / DSM 43021 / JCM 3005 / KCTC 9067 / NCIMB 10171 / NRRL 2505 / NI 9100) TaxID=479432 RepID=D2BFA5_STRRD|nr:MFS transporter [Streptosporangium roseum]ACZ88263.1 major facilitator superfamily permease/BtlA- like protein [Streptosporangium roseum DSM 43021]